MGSSLSASCQRAHTGGRGHPGSGAHPTQRVSSGVMERASQGMSEAGLFLRAVSNVQGKEPHRPYMRALPGPGGGQAFLPQASHTGRRDKRPRGVHDEDPAPYRRAVRNQAHRVDAVERSWKRSPTRRQERHAGQAHGAAGGPAAARPHWPEHAARRWRAPPGRCRERRCRPSRSHSLGPALSARGSRQARPARRGSAQMPPDCVVKEQPLDMVQVMSSLIWRRNIIRTPCRNREWRCEALSPSEIHGSPTTAGGM
jgi:hypothetical protein